MIMQRGVPEQISGLSAQVVINCQVGGGDCEGGDPAKVYEFAYQYGLADSSCMNDMQTNLKNGDKPC
jgi:hypothetical protein